MRILFRATNGESAAAQAQDQRREAQLRALEKSRAAEKELCTRITVIIKAIQKGWEYASAYEQVMAGKKEDPFDEKARKLMEDRRKDKEREEWKSLKVKGDYSETYRQRPHPYDQSHKTHSWKPQGWSEQQSGFPPNPYFGPQWAFPSMGYNTQSQTMSQDIGFSSQAWPSKSPSWAGADAQPNELNCFACGNPGHLAKYCIDKM